MKTVKSNQFNIFFGNITDKKVYLLLLPTTNYQYSIPTLIFHRVHRLAPVHRCGCGHVVIVCVSQAQAAAFSQSCKNVCRAQSAKY